MCWQQQQEHRGQQEPTTLKKGNLPLQWEEPWSTRVGNPLSLLLGLNTSEEKGINLQLSGLRTGKGHLRGLESPGKITGEGGKAPCKVVYEILRSPHTAQGLTLNSVQKPEN